MNEVEQKIAEFLKVAVPRKAGVTHTISGLERDSMGNIVSFYGSITQDGKTRDAIWTIQGQEASTGNADYSLVTKHAFQDWLDSFEQQQS